MKRNHKIGAKMAKVFTIGISVCLVLAFIMFLFYLLAFILGGSGAEAICLFLKTWYIPVLYIMGTIVAIFGLVKVYICGEKYFVLEKPKSAKSGEDA